MGEVEENLEERNLGMGLRLKRRAVNWLLKDEVMQLERIETKYLTEIQEYQEENRRLRQQRDFFRDDVGQFKTRWKYLAIEDYNPEEISFDEYKKMLDYDSQVIAGWDLIKMGVLMKPYRIRHSKPEIAQTLEMMLNRMYRPNIRDSMKEMMKAIVYGYSTTEVVFEHWTHDGKQYFAPRQTNGLKTFDPETIKFYSDDFGNLYKVEQRIAGDRIELPLWRTLVWTHEKESGNFYGKSLLRGCYKNWYIKDVMLKFANIAYERFGSPSLLGIARNVTEGNKMLTTLQHLYAYSQGVLVRHDSEDPTDVKVIESKRNEMPFDRYIRYHDEMILRRMLIGQNIFEGGGSTYGPKVPFDIILMRMQDFRMELEAIMQQFLSLITLLNWPVQELPRFEFEPLTTMDAEQLRSAIWEAIDRKVLRQDNRVHRRFILESLGFPDTDESEAPPDEEENEEEVE